MFVYGTLLIEDLWLFLIGRVPSMYPAVLNGYHRYQVQDRPYPGLWHKDGSQTQGMWVSGLNENEITCVDEYEGSEYHKVKTFITLLEKSANQSYGRPYVSVYLRAPKNEDEWSLSYEAPLPTSPIPSDFGA